MLWDLETGAARQWSLPWALTEALVFAGPDRLLSMRQETRDGSRPPDSSAPPTEYPRLCVLRDLMGPTQVTPMKVITDFHLYVQDIEAAPGGTHFVVHGKSGTGTAPPRHLVRLYDTAGEFVRDLSGNDSPADRAGDLLVFDPTGKLLVLDPGPKNRQVLLDMPSGRFLGTAPARTRGVSPGARWWAQADERGIFHLCDRAGNRLVDLFSEGAGFAVMPFSPDHDGRYLLCGNPYGLVSVADLVEVERRLVSIGLGW
jgi:hypothetical protein